GNAPRRSTGKGDGSDMDGGSCSSGCGNLSTASRQADGEGTARLSLTQLSAPPPPGRGAGLRRVRDSLTAQEMTASRPAVSPLPRLSRCGSALLQESPCRACPARSSSA